MQTKTPAFSAAKFKARTCAVCLAVGAIVLMPEHSLHFLAVLAHTVYETIAYTLEHLLIRFLGTSKFQAQMAVFYLSLTIGLGTTYILLRRIPFWLASLREYAVAEQRRIMIELSVKWLSLPNRHKFAVLMVNAIGLAGSMMVLLA